MYNINKCPALAYFLLCAFAWSTQLNQDLASNGLIAIFGLLLLGFTSVNMFIVVDILHDILDPLLDSKAQWGPVISINQSILLSQALNLLIIFFITNYALIKNAENPKSSSKRA